MEFDVRGDPDGGPPLDLDHRRFAYAGKFVMTNAGKAVAEDDGEVIAAAAFNRDRTDPETAWIRYVTVRADHRGEGIGARLLDYVAIRVLDDHGHVRIAVNNPYAYEACYKAGFCYTGERTGLAELVLERPADRSTTAYRDGLEAFRERDDLTAEERTYLAEKAGSGPPKRVVE